MNTRLILVLTSLGLLCVSAARAEERGPGWDFGADLIYQTSKDIGFKGGSSVSIDHDLGVALMFGYRFDARWELGFSFDWNAINYNVNVGSGLPGGAAFTGTGSLESFVPRIYGNFNFLEGPIAPYVTATVGWAFIDTNIPNGPPVSSCWWDPWFGYYCGTWQSTRSRDALVYGAGLGVRWDVTSGITLRAAYEKHWVDLQEANSTPGFNQWRLGISARY